MRHTGIASVNDASAVKPDGSLLHLTSRHPHAVAGAFIQGTGCAYSTDAFYYVAGRLGRLERETASTEPHTENDVSPSSHLLELLLEHVEIIVSAIPWRENREGDDLEILAQLGDNGPIQGGNLRCWVLELPAPEG